MASATLTIELRARRTWLWHLALPFAFVSVQLGLVTVDAAAAYLVHRCLRVEYRAPGRRWKRLPLREHGNG